MNNDITNKIFARISLIFIFLLVLYYMITSFIIQHFYHEPLNNISIYFAYIKYLIANIGNIDNWSISLPETLRIFFAQKLGTSIDGVIKSIPAIEFDSLLQEYFHSAYIFKFLLYYGIISIITSIYVVIKFWYPSNTTKNKYIRGAKTISSSKLTKILVKDFKKTAAGISPLYSDPIVLPIDYETRHVLTVGSTGAGKSVMLCNFINCMTRRNGKIVLYDRKGELITKFYRDNDILINPYDRRFIGWSIFNEFDLYTGLDHIPEELTNLAQSLFSVANESKNKAFYDGAASIFKSGCCWLKINKKTTNKDLFNFFTQKPSDIKNAIDSLPHGLREGQAFLSGDGDVMASFISCLIDRVKSFQSFIGKDGALSIRKWINNKDDKRRLILSTTSSNDELYLPILTMIIDIIGHGLRDKSENTNRRIFFVLDELSSLPPLKTLQMLLREGRSRGASCWLTTQTMSAIESKYGKNNTADIMGLCNSLFVFRTNEPQQSQYFSSVVARRFCPCLAQDICQNLLPCFAA
ncbi:type IV secretion system DNA-binding domain-containing protein [Pectinatus brassicae]|uniref:Type IV secretion system coupling protein TraD DNA-binding domain-containing protein n=1 Tax=Pectinatus brassicae TaxID=862415 RepID=A0A840UXL2_9FIRM|nr:type IV secretion system DNA-binding domain-containing protein [Pectinatus brassicae]MBB5337604.1 hypothetical protein [Pectinatus brassicae]